MAYSLGKESTCTDKFIAIVMSTAAIVIAFQVLMTAQIRGLNINSSDLKWWMVIPIGQTNAIGTYFIPMVIVLDGFKNTKRGIYKSVLITIEWGLIASILFMGSRSTLILMGNQTNQGWKKNFKLGFDLATGDYIFPCDQTISGI